MKNKVMHKELLIDTLPIRFTLDESKGNKLVGRGVFARSGIPTANRRVYPESVWRKNVARLQKDIKERKVIMLVDHPESGKTTLKGAAALLTACKVEQDGTVIGEMEIIPGTPDGATLAALVEASVTIGVSSRGYGSVKMNQDGLDEVQDDFVLLTWDAVADPANATSWPTFSNEGGQEESKENESKNPFLNEVPSTAGKEMLMEVDGATKALNDIAYEDGDFYAVKTAKGYDLFQRDGVAAKKVSSINIDGAFERMKQEIARRQALTQKNKRTESDNSVLDAVKEIVQNAKPSEDPSTPPESADEIYGVFAKKSDDDYASVVPKQIFTDKKDAEYFAAQTDGLVVKPIKSLAKVFAFESTPSLSQLDGVIANIEGLLSKSKWSNERKSEIQMALQAYKLAKRFQTESISLEQEIVHTNALAKEFGFRLFLERSLSRHPKYNEICESLDFASIPDLEHLQRIVSVHVEDLKKISLIESKETSYQLTKIEEDLKIKLEKFSRELETKNKLIEEQSTAIKSLREEMMVLERNRKIAEANLYLESRLVGNPNAQVIRDFVQSAEIFENKKIDKLIESMSRNFETLTESSVYRAVRSSLQRRAGNLASLVEDSVSGTTLHDARKAIFKQNDSVIPGELSMDEFSKLAGIKNNN